MAAGRKRVRRSNRPNKTAITPKPRRRIRQEAEQSNDCVGTEANAQVKPSEQDGDSTKAATPDKNATPKQSEHSAVTAEPADSASTVLAPQGAGPADANAPYADVRAGQTDAARPAESPDDAARAGR